RLRKQLRSLAVIPGTMVSSDRVVVRDRAAAGDDRLGGRRLDLVPLLDLRPAPNWRKDREVRGGTIRVDVREPPAERASAADGAQRRLGCGHHGGVELLEAIPRDRGLEGLGQDSSRDEDVAHVRLSEEASAPAPHGAIRLPALVARLAATAMFPAALERKLHPVIDR